MTPGTGTQEYAEAATKCLQGQEGNENEQNWSEEVDWKWWGLRYREESRPF